MGSEGSLYPARYPPSDWHNVPCQLLDSEHGALPAALPVCVLKNQEPGVANLEHLLSLGCCTQGRDYGRTSISLRKVTDSPGPGLKKIGCEIPVPVQEVTVV